jgi:hypothetical protein
MARKIRRAYHAEPVSSLALWARRVAIFAAVAALVSTIVVRFGFLDVKPAVATLFGALACAAIAIVIGVAGLASIWQNGTRGVGHIVLALLISVGVVAYPGYLGWQYRRLPAIHDITTDPIDPPRFEALARLRTGEDTNSAVYAGLYSAEQQRAAYPEIEAAELDVPVQRAYEIVSGLVARRKWLVIDERPPTPPRRVGRIEAVARTLVMGFREDVSIRIAAAGDGSRVDVRSSSRYFEHDLGSNAARIAKLIDDINAAAENASAVKKAPPAKAPAKKK